MKNSNELILARREKLLAILKESKRRSIDDLSQQLEVSAMTIRRDCHVLEEMGKVTQKLGFVSLVEPSEEPNQAVEVIKERLGAEASRFIQDEEIIFMNSSSTALQALKYLLDKKVFILTNNANSTKFLNEKNKATLIMSGGEINNRLIMCGDLAVQSFGSMRADWGIIGCAGLNVDHGISSPFITEATVNRTIVQNSNKLIVVADYRKLNAFSNFTIGSIKDVDVLITDTFAPSKIINDIQKQGVRVIQIPSL